MLVLLLASTSFSLHLDYSIHFLWQRLHHFCSYSAYIELSRCFFFYDVYLCCLSDSRMFIVPILTILIWNTVSVHWKLLFIVLPLFTKILMHNFRHKMSLHLQNFIIEMKMTLNKGANMSTWKLTEHLKSCNKILP